MAPGRRKGRTTAAAAAAQLQWKVGDLVLAKMKGFPPWPAVISDPQKWGYSSDKRKLFVFFFGTKQIAFCNHADVEAFTEEKKRNLLGKRQGKGADFVRAVDEIIENFGTLTKRTVSNELCSGDDVESHSENAEDSSVNHLKKELFGASNGPSEAFLYERSNDSHSSEEIPMNRMEDDTAENKTLVRRFRDLLHSRYIQKRSRIKTGISSCALQKSVALAEDENADGCLLSDESTDDCSLNDNIMRKSLDAHNTSSEISTIVGNDGSDELGMYSSNERCIIESSCKVESRAENLDKGLALNRGFVVLKRKRKPNKKRSNQERGSSSKLEKSGSGQSEPSACLTVSFDSCHNSNDRVIQTDGDEHLPLVKRARVRMGNIPEEKKMNGLVGTVTKSENDIPPFDHNLLSNLNGNFGPTNGVMPVGGHVMSMHWKEKKYSARDISSDKEAALPPSKRLSRALEAMSANATETNDGCLEASTFISNADICRISPDVKCYSLRESDSTFSTDTCKNPSSNNSPVANACIGPLTEGKCEDISVKKCVTLLHANCEVKDEDICYSEELPKETELGLNERNPHQSSSFFNDEGNEKILCLPENGTAAAGVNDMNSHPSSSFVNNESNEKTLHLPDKSSVPAVLNCSVDVLRDDSVVDSVVLNSAMESSSSLFNDEHGVNVHEVSPFSNSTRNLIAASQAGQPLSQSGYLFNSYSVKCVLDEKSSDNLSLKNSTVNQTDSLDSSDKRLDFHCKCNEPPNSPEIVMMQSDNVSNENEKTLNSITHAKATVSFESLVSTLSRTKESIGRATSMAIDCMKHGIGGEVVQMLLHNLEKTVDLSRKLDLFFLVDSIAQCSRIHKDVAGDSYPSLFHSELSRLLRAAAPPGNNACDNRRQCLKVLKLWEERRILPESILKHHIRELELTIEGSFPPRVERPLNDPIREMEGMLVDEYGSNASFEIPGAPCSHPMNEEEDGGAGDAKSFGTVTPEHDSINSFPERHTHILEEVDGELEMEDASPQCQNDPMQQPFAPPLPTDNPPSPPPLPSSPPPADPLCHPINHADDPESHPLAARNSMQYSLPRPFSSPPCHYQSSYGYPCDPPLPSKGYHSQFSYDRPRFWRERNHSVSFDRRAQFRSESLGRNHRYSNGCTRRPVPSEISERCRFSSAARSGPVFPEKAEGSPNMRAYCGPPGEASSLANGWSNSPRTSSYHRFPVTASRPPFESPDFWRPTQ